MRLSWNAIATESYISSPVGYCWYFIGRYWRTTSFIPLFLEQNSFCRWWKTGTIERQSGITTIGIFQLSVCSVGRAFKLQSKRSDIHYESCNEDGNKTVPSIKPSWISITLKLVINYLFYSMCYRNQNIDEKDGGHDDGSIWDTFSSLMNWI